MASSMLELTAKYPNRYITEQSKRAKHFLERRGKGEGGSQLEKSDDHIELVDWGGDGLAKWKGEGE